MKPFFRFSLCLAVAAGIGSAPVFSALAQQGPRVRHVPPAEAPPSAPLTLSTAIDRAWESELAVRFRLFGTTAWQTAEFTRKTEDTYVATIPATSVQPPGVEYFIVSVSGSGETAHFASPSQPHRVNVYRDPVELRQMRQLQRHNGHRAQARVLAEYVDYGTREIAGKELADNYYRVDADVGYRVLRFPLKSLRFGYTHLIGTTPRSSRGDDGSCMPSNTVEECTLEAGLKGGGWFELGFLIGEGVEIDTRGMVMATQEGFGVGGRGEVRIGDSLGSHFAFGGEAVNDVGFSGYVRLAWNTVPMLPMAATVEVNNFPAPSRATAVRLIYDISRAFQNGLRVGGRIGYQARDQAIGGVTVGTHATFDF